MIYEKQFHRSIAYLRQVYAGYVVHLGVMEHGTISTEGPELLTCLVDYERRYLVQPNHSMTHVLNFALREVLLGGLEGIGSLLSIPAPAEEFGVSIGSAVARIFC